MDIVLWPIDQPVAYARNARIISDAAVDKVAGSIREFGWRQPIVVDAEGVIIAGHAIELNPAYVDIAVTRWQSFSGGRARREATGDWFDDLAPAGPGATG